MKPHLERRKSDLDPADALSPECLALLVSCGDEIRATDDVPGPPVVTRARHGRRREDRDRGDDGDKSDAGVAPGIHAASSPADSRRVEPNE